MTNFKRSPDNLPAIRLPKQSSLPTPQQIIEMAYESQRAKKRVEMFWQPSGRQEPVVLVIKPNDSAQLVTWTLYESPKADAVVLWAADNPDPSKVFLTLRDWAGSAGPREGWSTTGELGYSERNSAPLPHHWSQFPQVAPVVASAEVPRSPQPSRDSEQASAPWSVSQGEQESTEKQALGCLLGDILIAADVIPTRTLQAALTLQNASLAGRPRLGELLVNSGALPAHILNAALTLQEFLRAGLISDARVTEILRIVQTSGLTVEQILGHPSQRQTYNVPEPTPTTAPSGYAVPPAAPTTAPSGHAVPPASAFTVPPPANEPARSYSPQASPTPSSATPTPSRPLNTRGDRLLEQEGQVSDADRDKFKQVLNLIRQTDFTGQDGQDRAQRLLDLFKQSGVAAADQVDEAIRKSGNSADAVRSLLVKESVDAVTFQAALHSLSLLADGRFKPEQAIIALSYCQRSRSSLKDAINDLNWEVLTEDL